MVQANPGNGSSATAPANPGNGPSAVVQVGAKGDSTNAQKRPVSVVGPPAPLFALTTGDDGTTEDARESPHSDGKVETENPNSLSPTPRQNPQATTSDPDAERLDHGRGGEQRPSRVAGGAEDAEGAGIRAGQVVRAIDQLLGQDEGSPREVDLLAESLPFDAAKLDLALEHYLGRIGDLGGSLADLLISEHLLPWLQGAAPATTACVVAHQLHRKARPATYRGAGGEEILPPWLLDLRSEES